MSKSVPNKFTEGEKVNRRIDKKQKKMETIFMLKGLFGYYRKKNKATNKNKQKVIIKVA